jgi:biopolymer transport protein ExbD
MADAGEVGGVSTKSKAENRPNVVPMIDVMLVLLIIFMIVTPIISSGMQATMPHAREVDTRAEEDGDIVLGIDTQGRYYLDPGTGETGVVCRMGDASCDQEARLTELLTSIYTARTIDKILYMRAHDDLPYGVIQDAVEVCRVAGVRVLANIATERSEGTSIMGASRGGE